MVSALVFLAFLLLGPAALSSAAAAGGEFDYSNGTQGPWNWGNLKAEWKLCKAGSTQSPVDIRLDYLQPVCALRLLQVRYGAANATLSSLDHDIGLSFAGNAGTLTIDGVTYELSEYHIHSPSEHSINGQRYAAEGHLVHKASDGKIAVVSLLYSIGSEEDAFIDQVEHLLPALGSGGEMHAGLVDPSKLNVAGKRFYRYVGSLTTPPCTQGVTWNILRRPRTLSTRQFQLLKDALNGDNSRPLQAANGRVVSYHK